MRAANRWAFVYVLASVASGAIVSIVLQRRTQCDNYCSQYHGQGHLLSLEPVLLVGIRAPFQRRPGQITADVLTQSFQLTLASSLAS